MILKKEIEKIALLKGVPRSTIDKDWILGHFLDAIFSIPECRDKIVFKGGTCLRKCYFEDFRFSEDLDFTAVDQGFVLNRKLLGQITEMITHRAGIPLYVRELNRLIYQDMLTGFAATVQFWGADHPRNQLPPPPRRWQSSIKIEIILYEKMIFPPVERPVYHRYSDHLTEISQKIPCYSIPEVLSEKLRSLIQRSYSAPRDLYDIWYLSRQVSASYWPEIVQAFHQKVKFKGLEFTGIDQMINPEKDERLETAWENSLAYQVFPQPLLPYRKVRDELVELFSKIFS